MQRWAGLPVFVFVAILVPCVSAPAVQVPGAARTGAEVVFHLPFESGFSVNVWQGNDQKPSHHDSYNRFAVDFSPLPEGTPVVAAADGRVVFVKEDTAGPTGNWRDNNRVVLQHRNGLFSEYTHLRKDGALVVVGQEVLAGDRIAESGNTGNSAEPHLHFNVLRHWISGPSVPSRFADVPGDGVPVRGQIVTSGNIRVRELLEYRLLDQGLAVYRLGREVGAVEAALPFLKAMRAVNSRSSATAVTRLLSERDRVLAEHEAEAWTRCGKPSRFTSRESNGSWRQLPRIDDGGRVHR